MKNNLGSILDNFLRCYVNPLQIRRSLSASPGHSLTNTFTLRCRRWLLRVPICCLASAYLCIVTYMSEVKFFWNFLCLKKLVSAALQVPICCSRSCCHRYCRSCCCCCCHRCSRSCCCCCFRCSRSCCSCCRSCCHRCSRSCCCCCRSCCSCCFRCCCRSCCCCCSFSYASLTLRKQN